MTHLAHAPARRNTSAHSTPAASPFRMIDAFPIGNGDTNIAIEAATVGGRQLLKFRNHQRDRGGMLPAGSGAVFFLDQIPSLVAALERMRVGR